MSDLISRQAAMDCMMRLQREDEEAYGVFIPEGFDGERAAEALRQLPSAQPEPQWIPCSERLPEENTPVLLGVRFKDDFKYFVTVRTDYNYWHGLGRDIRGEMRWCKLPEPWRGEEHDKG